MQESTEINRFSDSQLLDSFQSELERMDESGAAGYRKAVVCLRSFAEEYPEISPITSAAFLQNWLVSMFWRGLTVNTALHYLDIVSALCSHAVRDGFTAIEASENFRRVKKTVKRFAPQLWRSAVSDEEFTRFTNFTKHSVSRPEDGDALFKDILLFSLINKGMNISEVAKLKVSNLPDYDDESRAIAGKYLDSRRRYVFPLLQSGRTARQLESYLRGELLEILQSHNIAMTGSIENTLRTYWSYAALKSGMCGSGVLGAVGSVPPGLPVLAICTDGASLRDENRNDRAVSKLFLTNPVGWYAMHLRAGVKFDMLSARISGLHGRLPVPEIYYPVHVVRRKTVPVLPGIVFFRSRMTDIQPIFSEIGDIAWCYRTMGGGRNSYSQISSSDMDRFKMAIGQFTDETEIFPAGTIKPEKNDRVEILGGLFAGYQARFDSALNEGPVSGGGRVIYRLMLSADNGIEWSVKLDPRLVGNSGGGKSDSRTK